MLVYSGIHYDVVALSPSEGDHGRAYAPPEFDTKVFPAADAIVLEKAVELWGGLKGRAYYTDTAGFTVRCADCGEVFVGQKGAVEHATRTGHTNFGEG